MYVVKTSNVKMFREEIVLVSATGYLFFSEYDHHDNYDYAYRHTKNGCQSLTIHFLPLFSAPFQQREKSITLLFVILSNVTHKFDFHTFLRHHVYVDRKTYYA